MGAMVVFVMGIDLCGEEYESVPVDTKESKK